ncbi:hypothetical protein MHYP_G00233350 [Metynnis hypsauchen]
MYLSLSLSLSLSLDFDKLPSKIAGMKRKILDQQTVFLPISEPLKKKKQNNACSQIYTEGYEHLSISMCRLCQSRLLFGLSCLYLSVYIYIYMYRILQLWLVTMSVTKCFLHLFVFSICHTCIFVTFHLEINFVFCLFGH